MANRILGGDPPFREGAGIGVGMFGSVSAAHQNLDGKIESVELITEENKHKIAGKLAWGAAGLLVFGPAGALAGLLLGGRKKEVCFACVLKDGKKFVAVTDPETHKKFLAASFKK